MTNCGRIIIPFARGLALVWIAATLAGCGSNITRQPAPQPVQPLVIVTQPASQSIPLGNAATFTVAATGTAPLSYQWSMNGTKIQGATSSSYTSPDVTAEDTGETFTVVISDLGSSITSSPATLTVGPRSPKSGDLRFQQVGAPSEAGGGTGPGFTLTFPDLVSGHYPNTTGSPLEIGYAPCYPGIAFDCAWGLFGTPLPPGQTGLSFYYDGGQLASYDSDIASASAPNVVFTSLDLQPANGAYAITWMQTTQTGGFDLEREIVSPGMVETTVAQDAARSRVITAVSFDVHGQANLFSYGWQGDKTTVYDTRVISAAPEEVSSDVAQLASQGYILTAFGGDITHGFLLIGTKVKGDTLPRLVYDVNQSSSPTAPGVLNGYAPVAWFTYLASKNFRYDTIYEK
ncbi:MAG: immunoglobulin domain-containing protein [Acidobacteria bacterium]|nr:immunoglobulin domain-containing protein [Acidobacteriota bacterium]MBW4045029.1 immunoglobulin domain-containing protein [Acidobacteriota bacterium]